NGVSSLPGGAPRMTARRPLLSTVLFLASVGVLGSPAAGWCQEDRVLSPEEIRAVLGRIGGLPPDQDPFNEMIRQHVERQGFKVDPKQLQGAIDRVRGNADLMKRLEEIARQRQATGKPPNAAELEKALQNLPLKDIAKPAQPPGGPGSAPMVPFPEGGVPK